MPWPCSTVAARGSPPRWSASDAALHEQFYDTVDAPFVGNGFTRWVDGQFALDQPELGLSNWQYGRLFARSGVLSGDSVYTVRLRAHVPTPTSIADLRRRSESRYGDVDAASGDHEATPERARAGRGRCDHRRGVFAPMQQVHRCRGQRRAVAVDEPWRRR